MPAIKNVLEDCGGKSPDDMFVRSVGQSCPQCGSLDPLGFVFSDAYR